MGTGAALTRGQATGVGFFTRPLTGLYEGRGPTLFVGVILVTAGGRKFSPLFSPLWYALVSFCSALRRCSSVVPLFCTGVGCFFCVFGFFGGGRGDGRVYVSSLLGDSLFCFGGGPIVCGATFGPIAIFGATFWGLFTWDIFGFVLGFTTGQAYTMGYVGTFFNRYNLRTIVGQGFGSRNLNSLFGVVGRFFNGFLGLQFVGLYGRGGVIRTI